MSERLTRVVLLVLLWLAGSAFAAELDRHTVEVDGHPFALWSKVPERPAAVMLLIHGLTWSTRPDFDLQVPGESLSLMDGLVDRGVATYGIDLRGYGETPRDDSGWLTPDQAARDVVAVLGWIHDRHRSLPPPVLFGWSNGALVAQLAAQRFGSDPADSISGLILFGYPLRDAIFDRPEPVEPARARTTAEAAASDFILPGTISDAAIETFVASALESDPVRTDWRDLSQWRALDGAKIHTPTLLLQAEHDPLAIDAQHAALFSALATGDKVWAVLPGGDHAAFMETPRSYFLTLIEGFLFRGTGSPAAGTSGGHADGG